MIPYGKQSINQSDIEAVALAMNQELITTGPQVDLFEEKLKMLTGANCVVVSSGTAALHCAYAAIGIEPGDEVITSPLTFIATQATAALMGAKIVFSDIQKDTGNIDPQKVSELITSKTKAIVAVDYAGHPADLDELKRICEQKKIFLIEDAAHSIGSKYKNMQVGSIADITTFSFFPTKNITTAEGGALASLNNDIISRAKLFARQGLIRKIEDLIDKNVGPWHQEVHHFGLNYRLPDLLCALGISQLNRIQVFKSKRQEIFETYSRLVENIEGLTKPIQKSYVSPMWHFYPIQVPSEVRKEVYICMREKGIGVQVNYLPAYRHPVFSKCKIDYKDFPNCEDFYSKEISLPLFPDLTLNEIEYITETLNLILKKLQR